MNYLIDTHTLICFIEGDTKLSDKARELVEDKNLIVGINIVSFWELSIKISLGKLKLKSPLIDIINQTEKLDIKILQIKPEYIYELEKLPFHHKDPFDRMIIANAIAESIPVISLDENFDKYSEIKRIW
jgi:PIN domain nuclease of toxin-antitoxin system